MNVELLELLEQKNRALAMQMQGKHQKAEKVGALQHLPKLPEGDGVLCLYQGFQFDSLEPLSTWLEAHESCQLIFLEKDIQGVKALLRHRDIIKLLQQPRVEVGLVEQWSDEKLAKLAWTYVFKELYWVSSEEAYELQERFQSAFREAFVTCSEYRDYGLKVMSNIYANMFLLPRSKEGRRLTMQGIPAFICGAGPSLAQLLPTMSQLLSLGVVFAGGASFSSQEMTHVDLGACIDPSPPYARYKESMHVETPLMYQLRLSHEVLKIMHGVKIFFPGSGEYFLEQELFADCGETCAPLPSGWNVANFMATVAAEMGCDPIVLIGVDMCYERAQEYGVQVVGDQVKNECSITLADGTEKMSRKDLLMGRHFFSSLVERYPSQRFINATVGGSPIEGMMHRPLQEIIASLSMRYDIKGLLHTQLTLLPEVSIQEEAIKSFQQNMQRSLRSVANLLDIMLAELEKSYLHQKENISKNYWGAAGVLAESDLEEEMAYRAILQPVWRAWKWALLRREEQDSFEDRLQKTLFLKSVLQQHEALLEKIYTVRTGYGAGCL